MVTGGSEGIGFEICLQMARKGFNICMVARNEEKMKKRLADIREATQGNVKLMHVVADFSEMLFQKIRLAKSRFRLTCG